jgi:hypothetical protein
VQSKIDYWKLETRKKFQALKRSIPLMEDLEAEEEQRLRSKYPLRLLGIGDHRLTITEEERPHAHLIGSTREGKSKFIEHLIRGDILRGFGVCLIDPSVGGRTAYDVLKWCCKQGLEKVCLIDPHHIEKLHTVPCINPFLYHRDRDALVKIPKLKKTSVDTIVDAVRVLFQVKDAAQNSFINRYLPAVLNCLWEAEVPLSEALYFTNQLYVRQRMDLLSYLDELDPGRVDLEEAFSNFRLYTGYYQTTINRLKPFTQTPLNLIFGADRGIDFMKMVAEKWVILVNLDTSLDLDVMDARLIGTMIINQVILAQERLIDAGYGNRISKRYYLYIDEAGEYATYKVARTLELKGKTGLRLTLGHQHFGQFSDESILNAVMVNAPLKAMFNLPGREDRDRIVRMFYGGEISDRDASWANADLPKQYAVIKAGKFAPQRVRIPDIKDPYQGVKDVDKILFSYLTKIYSQPWYKTPEEIYESRPISKNTNSPQSGKTPHRKADREAPVSAGVRSRRRKDLPAGDEKPKNAGEKRPIKI